MGVFAVSFVMNLLAFPYMTMVPVIGRETLEIDAVRIGLLTSAEGLGRGAGIGAHRRAGAAGLIRADLLLRLDAVPGLRAPSSLARRSTWSRSACSGSPASG